MTTRRAEQIPTEEEIIQPANQGEDVQQPLISTEIIPPTTTQVEVQQPRIQNNQQQMG